MKEWIKQHYPTGGYGQCKEATQHLQDSFPGLRRVRGHYHCPVWGQREHWWCEDSQGEIVDPTAGQFPSKGHGTYTEWDDSQPEPVGKCMNCGSYTYEPRYNFCTDSCEAAVRADMGI